MIIENRWFVLQGPRRADLSGNPFGFLLVWLGGVGALPSRGRFERHPHARQFGFFLPLMASLLFRHKRYEFLEVADLIARDDYIPHDWRKWPDGHREAADAAVARAVSERPGSKIVSDWSRCDRRADLSGRPLQLYRAVVLQKAA